MPNGGSPTLGCLHCGRKFTVYGHDGLGCGAGLPVITSHHSPDGGGRYVGRFVDLNVLLCFGCEPLEGAERARWLRDYNNIPQPGTTV